MIYKGVLITAASGRLDQGVFARCRGTDYVRALGNPNPNPPTAEQTACRDAMAEVITQWQGLSVEQRQAWDLYSREFPGISRLGDVRSAGGLAEFTRSNISRIQQNNVLASPTLSVITDPPGARIYSVPRPFPTATAVIGDNKITITFDDTSAWWNDSEGGCLVYFSPWLEPTINFYKTPMTLGAFLSQNTGPSPIVLATGVTPTAGQRVRLRFKILRGDGLVSLDWWLDIPAV